MSLYQQCPILSALCSPFYPSILAASSPTPAQVEGTTGERSQFKLSQTENMEIRQWMDGPLCVPPVSASCHSLTDKLTFWRAVPIPVRVYWRWFWSPPWGHSSDAAICHLDCMAASLGGAPWLLIVYRLRCFRLHKGHMHRARWWAYTLIMSLYLCAGRSGTIRPPSGSSLLSTAMLFFHKYSPLPQLSLAYDNTHTQDYLSKKKTHRFKTCDRCIDTSAYTQTRTPAPVSNPE